MFNSYTIILRTKICVMSSRKSGENIDSNCKLVLLSRTSWNAETHFCGWFTFAFSTQLHLSCSFSLTFLQMGKLLALFYFKLCIHFAEYLKMCSKNLQLCTLLLQSTKFKELLGHLAFWMKSAFYVTLEIVSIFIVQWTISQIWR